MAQFKFLIVLLAALCFAQSYKISPCKPGYVQIEDCLIHAIDPAEGNCWWAAEMGSCEIYAPTEAKCAEYCRDCYTCLWIFGCCEEGNLFGIQHCTEHCIANMQYGEMDRDD